VRRASPANIPGQDEARAKFKSPAVSTLAGVHRRSSAFARNSAARYREARKSLGTPSSPQSRRVLDWMNFFVADVQTGFGTFVAFYLAHLGWSPSRIGIVLTVGGLAGVVMQLPGGILADNLAHKRALVASGIASLAVAALTIALMPSFVAVTFAEILHGVAAGIITPAIGAISLGLVGRRAMSLRTGRNYRYAAAGHALTAGMMGLAGAFLFQGAIFVAAALLCIPALIALGFIRPAEIDYSRARNAATGERARDIGRIGGLLKNRKLILFSGALVLFQLADASMLPLVGEHVATTTKAEGSIWMSGLIMTPQIVVAVLAPWVGYHSEKRGRRPLLLTGFAIEPIRAVLLALSTNYTILFVAQVLDGITGAFIGILTVLVVTDLTTGTGRFNLARGAVGAVSGLAASISTMIMGFLLQGFGRTSSFLVIAAVACAATALLWVFLSETKPEHYLD
jgi:MFS family permease